MKRITIVLLVLFFILTGCATHLDPNYRAYTEAMKAQFTREDKPLVKIELYPDGKVKTIEMRSPKKFVNIQQKRPSPAWGLLGNALKIAGGVGTVYTIGHSLGNILESVGKSAGGNINIGKGNTWSSGRDTNTSFGGGVSSSNNTNVVKETPSEEKIIEENLTN